MLEYDRMKRENPTQQLKIQYNSRNKSESSGEKRKNKKILR